MRRVTICGLLLLALAGRIEAAMLGTGNVLVSVFDNHVISEYTPDGVFVQSFSVTPTSEGSTARLRDIVVGQDGNIYAYNGTGEAELVTIDPVTSLMTTQSLSGLSTVNNVSYGGIATLDDSVFLTDMTTSGVIAQGIVKFSTTGGYAVRFATTEEYQDLTIGIDGYLYALREPGSAIDIFDPVTNAFIRTIDFGVAFNAASIRGISVDADGTIYMAGWDGILYSVDSNGQLIASIDTGINDLTDIDINNSGNLLVGSRSGDVIFSDTSLSSTSSFTSVSGETVHVSFSDPLQIQSQGVPEPGSLVLLGLTACGFGFAARRKRQAVLQEE